MSIYRLPDYLEHIRQAASDARTFVEGLVKADFLADKRTQQAVILNLVIIGEAATKIMDGHPEFTQAHPEVPWRDARHAQPHRARLLRHQSGCGLGYGGERVAGVIAKTSAIAESVSGISEAPFADGASGA